MEQPSPHADPSAAAVGYPVCDVFWGDVRVFGLIGGEIVFVFSQNNQLVGFNAVIKTLTRDVNSKRIAIEPPSGKLNNGMNSIRGNLRIAANRGDGGTPVKDGNGVSREKEP